jgi:hypothetical protein
VLGNLINRHDAVRLGRRLRRAHVAQIVSPGPAPGPDRVPAHRPAAGILHMALHGIAHNFLADDPGTTQVIQACLAAEEQALPRLGADFACAVCSPRAEPWTGLEAGHVTATRARTPGRLGYDVT